jgi:hypothetical protein
MVYGTEWKLLSWARRPYSHRADVSPLGHVGACDISRMVRAADEWIIETLLIHEQKHKKSY